MPAFTVSRSIRINADTETVFATVSDFATWQTWSPWLLCDSEANVTLNGNPKEVGGGYSWEGPVVGAGEMEHGELDPPGPGKSAGQMRAELRFLKPWKSQSKVRVNVTKARADDGGDASDVQWEMDGSLPIFLFFLKKMMVSMLSMDFDRGLKMLKELIETGGIKSNTSVVGIEPCDSIELVGLSGRATLSEIGPAMDATIQEVKKKLEAAGVSTEGQWLSLYDDMCLKTQTLDYLSGIQLPAGTPTPAGLQSRSVTPIDSMHVSHTGAYEHLGNAWAAAYRNLQANKRKPNPKHPGVELYLNSPQDTPPEELKTEVYVPLK